MVRPIDPPRELTEHERVVLDWLLAEPFDGRDVLLQQAETVRVWGECSCGCGTIDLMVPGMPRGLEPGGVWIAAAGQSRDSHRTPLTVQLHVVNGVLRELEFVWFAEFPAEARDDTRAVPDNLVREKLS